MIKCYACGQPAETITILGRTLARNGSFCASGCECFLCLNHNGAQAQCQKQGRHANMEVLTPRMQSKPNFLMQRDRLLPHRYHLFLTPRGKAVGYLEREGDWLLLKAPDGTVLASLSE